MSVDSIPSATANSYISNADAISVWSNDPYKLDYATVITDQDIALKAATTMLDDVYGDYYNGVIYDTSYSLYWPRERVNDPRTGEPITDYASYPSDLARATALQAYHISAHNRQEETADLVSANTREKLDGVGEVERGTTGQQRSALSRPTIHPEVARIMSNFVTGGTSQYCGDMVRG
jgi:hypothetical protein